MKKILMVIASLVMLVGLVGASHAATTSQEGAASTRTTAAPRAIQPSQDTNVSAALKSGARLSTDDLAGLGLKPVAGDELAMVEKAKAKAAKNAEMRTSTVGTYYYYTWQDGGHSWADRYYSYSYYHSNYYYLYFYDNYKICGSSCVAANAYLYHYYIYYYGTWYGPSSEYGAYAG